MGRGHGYHRYAHSLCMLYSPNINKYSLTVRKTPNMHRVSGFDFDDSNPQSVISYMFRLFAVPLYGDTCM